MSMQTAQISPERQAELLKQMPSLVESDADTIQVGLTVINGNIALTWSNSGSVGRWDWVGLFNKDPQTAGAYGSLTYQWVAGHSSPYITSYQPDGGAYWSAYWSWDYNKREYVLLQSYGPVVPTK